MASNGVTAAERHAALARADGAGATRSWRRGCWCRRCRRRPPRFDGRLDYRLVLDGRRVLPRLARNGGACGGRRTERPAGAERARGLRAPDGPGDVRTARRRREPAAADARRQPAHPREAPARAEAAQHGGRPDDARHRPRGRRPRTRTSSTARCPTRSTRSGRAVTGSAIKYEIDGDETAPGGELVRARRRRRAIEIATEPPGGRAGRDRPHVALAPGSRSCSGDLTPNEAMQQGLVARRGPTFPVTLMGRWIERSEGRDDEELEREERQRRVQERRATWGSGVNGAGAGARAIRPSRRGGAPQRAAELLSYEELYALWERQNWRAHEIDFTVDKEQWLATPTESPARHDLVARRASTSARSASPPTWRRSCSPRRAARSRSSSPRSSWTRRGTLRSSTASWPRCSRSSRRTCAAGSREMEELMLPGLAPRVRRPAARHREADPGQRPTTSTCSSRASSPTTW